MRPVIVQPKENIMSKTTFKNMFWMSLPLALAVGCAHTQPQTAPVYSDVPPRALAPTSERPVERVYAEQDSITRTAAPSGASAADWALNERIRGLLTGNKTLDPFPGEVMATVDKQNRVWSGCRARSTTTWNGSGCVMRLPTWRASRKWRTK
jgi:hypothetical protein